MAFKPGEKRNEKEEMSLKLAGSGADSAGGHEALSTSMPGNEAFLQEAFRRDEWLGCTLVFDHYYAPMCSHAVRYVYSKEYAEDVVADVFREFWQKKQYNKVTTSYRTYLFRAVRNRALNMIRRELRQTIPIPEDISMVSGAMRPDEQMMYDQFYQNIQKCIDELSPMCRKVFLMSRYEHRPLKEIAQMQGISIRTVEAHISKALAALRSTLKSESL